MSVTECTKNSERYLSRYIGDADEFYIELEQYVKDKTYDTRFCDLIPSIISNVLELTVIIVDKSVAGYHVYATTPLHSSDSPPADIINSNFLVLHRNEDHYDACIKITPQFYSQQVQLLSTRLAFLRQDKQCKTRKHPRMIATYHV